MAVLDTGCGTETVHSSTRLVLRGFIFRPLAHVLVAGLLDLLVLRLTLGIIDGVALCRVRLTLLFVLSVALRNRTVVHQLLGQVQGSSCRL